MWHFYLDNFLLPWSNIFYLDIMLLPWCHISTLISFYYRDAIFSTLISFYCRDATFSTLISFYCRDATFSTLISFYYCDVTFSTLISFHCHHVRDLFCLAEHIYIVFIRPWSELVCLYCKEVTKGCSRLPRIFCLEIVHLAYENIITDPSVGLWG